MNMEEKEWIVIPFDEEYRKKLRLIDRGEISDQTVERYFNRELAHDLGDFDSPYFSTIFKNTFVII